MYCVQKRTNFIEYDKQKDAMSHSVSIYVLDYAINIFFDYSEYKFCTNLVTNMLTQVLSTKELAKNVIAIYEIFHLPYTNKDCYPNQT